MGNDKNDKPGIMGFFHLISIWEGNFIPDMDILGYFKNSRIKAIVWCWGDKGAFIQVVRGSDLFCNDLLSSCWEMCEKSMMTSIGRGDVPSFIHNDLLKSLQSS